MKAADRMAILQNRILELGKENKRLHESITYLTGKLYGRSSEKTSALSIGQVSLFDEPEVGSDPKAMEKSPMPYPVIQHSIASPSTVAWIMHQKFVNALPKEIYSPEATLPSQGVRYCNKLFEIEKSLEKLSCEKCTIRATSCICRGLSPVERRRQSCLRGELGLV